MGSEIQSDRAQAQDLRDVQESYRKKRKAIETDGQTDLERARNENNERLKNENDSSEAAINHVRGTSAKEIERAKAENEQKLFYERNSLRKALQNSKDSGRETIENLDESLRSRETQLAKDNERLLKKESELHEREGQLESQFNADRSEHHTEALKAEEQQLEQVQKRNSAKKIEIIEKGREDQKALAEAHVQELHTAQKMDHDEFERQQKLVEAQLKHEREQGGKALENERGNYVKSESSLRAKAEGDLHKVQDDSTKQLGEMKQKSKVEIEGERLAGTKSLEKTRAYYDKSAAAIRKNGDERIHENQETTEHQLAVLDKESKERLQLMHTQHDEEMNKNADLFKKEETQGQTYYRNALIEQRRNYESQFKKNIESFQATVHDQREKLTQTLAKEKLSVSQNIGRYNIKNEDPFYQVARTKATLSETKDSYIVEAQVPEHEKDNIHVVVRDNRVIVAGDRRFEDQVQSEDGKIATHTYQTFRQEIPLEHPVRERYVQSNYDNGILTVKIPKA